MSSTARNVLIVVVLAALVALVPAAADVAGLLRYLVSVAFLGSLGWFGIVLYRQNRFTLDALGDRNRAILYGAVGVAALTVTATPTLWDTGIGVVLWFALVGGASYAVYAVVMAYRSA